MSTRPLLVVVASCGKDAVFEDKRESADGDQCARKRGSADVDDPAEKDEHRPDDGACRVSGEPPEQRDATLLVEASFPNAGVRGHRWCSLRSSK